MTNVFAVMTAIPLVIALFLLLAGLLQWLWNITMPDVFNLKKINYWQAFRLLLIAGLLFGGGSRVVGH
ncbi:MAG: hypothetical protein PWQ68_779 [Thermoanaerobacteraceae bacterium]|nr:hypothetical protein [Thermoanaerobacteraceae bacterium]